MASYDATIEIAATPDDVFPFLVEPDRLRRWVGGFVEAQPLTTGATGLGSRSIDVVREGSREIRFETEIVVWEPPERVSVSVRGSGMDAISHYRLERRDATTHVSHLQEVRYSGLLRVMGPLVGGMVRRKLAEDLRRLKEVVEEEGR